MRIGIDCRLWSQTGVGRYIRNLVFNLQQLDQVNNYVLFAGSRDFEDIRTQVSNSKWEIVKTDIKWHTISEQIKFPQILNSYKLDLMHFPYFSVPLFYKGKFVVTVHDLINNKFNTGKASTLPYPIYLIKKSAYSSVINNAVKKAAAVIVPSNSVKQDVLKTYKSLQPDKITVTYEGGFLAKQNILSQRLVREDYLLRVGNFYPHKNVENLLAAFKGFIADIPDENVKLVLVGKKDFFYRKIEKRIFDLGISKRIIFFENPTDTDLMLLYKNALATIVPSFMEGFSLTCVEAMSMGCVVAASNIPVHKEICFDGAIYFDPNDVIDLEKKINMLFFMEDSVKQKLIEKGKVRANEFSWRKMAQETLGIYNLAYSG